MEAGKVCKKTSLQLELLEKFYAEERYPKPEDIKEYAARVRLTYKQVRGWFVERRRKEKRETGGCEGTSAYYAGKFREICRSVETRGKRSYSQSNSVLSSEEYRFRVQDTLWSPDYIIRKILRKDGPPLGAEFDSIPDRSSSRSPVSASHNAGYKTQGTSKRRKVLKPQNCNGRDAITRKHGVGKGMMTFQQGNPLHGVGKGMMTLWRLTNQSTGDYAAGISFDDALPVQASFRKQSNRRKRLQKSRPFRKDNKKHEKKTKVPSQRRKEMARKLPDHSDCGLSLKEVASREQNDSFGDLMDDEELELRELHAGPNSVTCSAHFATSGLHRCSFCKDLLSKFPPTTLKMKQPFCIQPWQSSPEMVKQFFKAVHFLYTYSAVISICPITVDDFAQAFHDKDSMLLGKVHLCLLKFLLTNIERELSNGFPLQYRTSCKFLGLLQAVRRQETLVDDWSKVLNPLTWVEILRQIFVAAGYGSNRCISLKELQIKKEVNTMVKYGLAPGTLKGELFRILSQQGNNGLRVSELARFVQIEELEPHCAIDELELLISSALSSDITMFEKISPLAYRIRINFTEENDEPDFEYSGSIDDCSKDSLTDSSSDSEHDSGISSLTQVHRAIRRRKQKTINLVADNEIDESHPGEVWLLGLAESEYSDLRIEEKLNALLALVDILCGMSCFRSKTIEKSCGQAAYQKTPQYGSGAKIKRSTLNQSVSRQSFTSVDQIPTVDEHPVDSYVAASRFISNEQSSGKQKISSEAGSSLSLHPMQSVFLGSDRRYNRYWLFLGPCIDGDPGHRRIYFESSEDGHWEVIDNDEMLSVLMSVLDSRGTREAFLGASLQKRRHFLLQWMSSRDERNSECRGGETCDQNIITQDSSSPVSDVDNILSQYDSTRNTSILAGAINFQLGKECFEKEKWDRLQSYDRWTWNSFYATLNSVKYCRRSYLNSLARCESCHDLYWRDEKHCKICHATFELDFDLEEKYAIHAATCNAIEGNNSSPAHKVLSSQLQSLKASIYAVESSMPEDSLIGSWSKSAHKLWIKRLRRTSSLAEVVQVLTDFVSAINVDWISACIAAPNSDSVYKDVITCFPPSPLTLSSVALWLVKLDALIAPFLERLVANKPQRNTRSKGLTRKNRS